MSASVRQSSSALARTGSSATGHLRTRDAKLSCQKWESGSKRRGSSDSPARDAGEECKTIVDRVGQG